MPNSGNMTIVNSEQKVKEEDPLASVAPEQTLSTIKEESLFEGICNLEIEASEAPITSTAATQFSVSEEKITTLGASIGSSAAAQFPVREKKTTDLQASINSTVAAHYSPSEEETTLQSSISPTVAQLHVREEKMATKQALLPIRRGKEQCSDRFVSLWSEAIQWLANSCSMEFNAPSAPICSTEVTQSSGREERRRTSEEAMQLSEVVENVIGGLENLCVIDDRQGAQARRSPLPSWYPRRPLQDITAVLNIGPEPSEEAWNSKKGSKKTHSGRLPRHHYDSTRADSGQQRAPWVPFKPANMVSATPKRSSLLRKGFR